MRHWMLLGLLPFAVACSAESAPQASVADQKDTSAQAPAKPSGEQSKASTPPVNAAPTAVPPKSAPQPGQTKKDPPRVTEQKREGTVRVKIDGEEMEILSVRSLGPDVTWCNMPDQGGLQKVWQGGDQDPDHREVDLRFRDSKGVESSLDIVAHKAGTGCTDTNGITGTLTNHGNWVTGDWYFTGTPDPACGLSVDEVPADITPTNDPTPAHFKMRFSGTLTTGWSALVAPAQPKVEIEIDMTMTPWVVAFEASEATGQCTNIPPK